MQTFAEALDVPVALSCVLVPEHIETLLPALTLGAGARATVAVALLVQPAELVTVTVYVPATAGVLLGF